MPVMPVADRVKLASLRKDRGNCVIALFTPALAAEVRFSSRDWKLLQEDYVSGSAAFLYEFGFLGITSVADGLRVGQTVDRTRQGALAAAEYLWSQLESQLDLLANDYLCEPERPHGVGLPATVSRRLGNVRVGAAEYTIEMPPGQCRLEAAPTAIEKFDPAVGRVCVRPVRHPIQDLRPQQVFRSDNYGDIRIRKRRRGTAWDVAIPALLEVLRNPNTPECLQIHNAHR